MGAATGCTGLSPKTRYIQGYGREANTREGRQWFKSYLLQGFLNPVIGGGEAAGEGIFTKPTHHELLLDHDGASVCMSFI